MEKYHLIFGEIQLNILRNTIWYLEKYIFNIWRNTIRHLKTMGGSAEPQHTTQIFHYSNKYKLIFWEIQSNILRNTIQYLEKYIFNIWRNISWHLKTIWASAEPQHTTRFLHYWYLIEKYYIWKIHYILNNNNNIIWKVFYIWKLYEPSSTQHGSSIMDLKAVTFENYHLWTLAFKNKKYWKLKLSVKLI